MDPLDQICKEWFQCRSCNKRRGGSCHKVVIEDVYEYTVHLNNANISIAIDCTQDVACHEDSCIIDKHFTTQIIDFVDDLGGSIDTIFSNDTSECKAAPGTHSGEASAEQRTCQGTAPFLQMAAPTEATVELTLEEKCAVKNVELIFLLDGSGSVTLPNFERCINFFKNISSNFELAADKTRVAFVQYATFPKLEFSFIDEIGALNAAFDAVEYMKGPTFTGAGLKKVISDVIPDAREGNDRLLIVLTDGQSFDDVETPSDNLRALGVDLYAIGVGQSVPGQLEEIASEPYDTYVFRQETDTGNFDDLFDEIMIALISSMCE